MYRLHTQVQTITTKSKLNRCLSITPVRSRKKKNSCEETDCCGNPINVQPKPKIYVERACHPCSFFTWKPKIPILESAPPLSDIKKKPFKKKHCFAGMKFLEQSLEETKKKAAECHKKCAAHPDCSPPPPPPPPPVLTKVRIDMLLILEVHNYMRRVKYS